MKINKTMQANLLMSLLISVTTLGAHAQTTQDLINDGKTANDVLVYGMGYNAQRFSPLTQINKSNVKKLVPIWSYSMNDNRGAESFPIIHDGIVYATTHNSTAAVDALTGKPIWRVAHEYPPETLRVVCCGIVNRGAAIYEGKIIRSLMNLSLIHISEPTRPY